MRMNRSTWTLGVLAAAMLATPALADLPKAPSGAGAAVFPKPKRAVALVEAAGRDARRAKRRREARGPVHPLADGRPDYGTAENGFGAARSGHTHSGQDIFAPAGTPLVAVSRGVVIEAGSDGGQGNYVHIYDEREDRTYVYMHLVEAPAVSAGDRVKPGQRVGGVGCTGSCWGDHLHFEVRAGKGWGGEPQDPMPLLRSSERG